jgi:hypothetical protein
MISVQEILDLFNNDLIQTQESSLSRVFLNMKEHDSGTITAFRYASDCGSGTPYTKQQNKQRNASLKSKLMMNGFSLTAVKGVYVENYGSSNAKEVKEDVFLCVDIKDSGNLEKVLRKLGEEFEQDSILFIPKGGTSGELIGTNHCEDSYPGFGKRMKLKNPLFGNSGEFMTKVKNRPFTLASESVIEECVNPTSVNGRFAVSAIAKKHWSDIDV